MTKSCLPGGNPKRKTDIGTRKAEKLENDNWQVPLKKWLKHDLPGISLCLYVNSGQQLMNNITQQKNKSGGITWLTMQ